MKMDPESGTSEIISQWSRMFMGHYSIKFFNDLRTKNLFCDAVLRLEDGGIFPVHRLILSVCSEYFMTLFTTPLHYTERTDILLPGVTSETMSLILEYAYMRSVDINQENVSTLFVSADYLIMPGLLELCCDFLKSIFTPENCIGIMLFARDYSSGLEGDARCFVMHNFEHVSQQSDELLELPPEELKAIIGADELNVKREEVVWDGVLRWINHDKENRKGKIVELMKKVRLRLLDMKFIREKVLEQSYVLENDECCAIILDAINYPRGLEIPDQEFARPRIPHEIVFVVGGWTCDKNNIRIYNIRANRWIEVEEIEPISQRAYHGTAVIGFNIYVIGGFTAHCGVKSCYCFNAVAKTWREVSPMHENRSALSVAVLDGLVYAIGGYNGRRYLSIVESAERYDYRTNRWTMIAPMNEKRIRASATTLNGKIYIVGGFNGQNYMNSAEVYDPEVNQWTLIASMVSVRSCHSCIAHHGFIYSIGGCNGESAMCSGEKYNPTTNAWMQISDMPHTREKFGIAVIEDTIFAVGGLYHNTKINRTVECYDENSNEWIAARNLNVPLVGLSACVIKDLPNVCDYIKYNKDGSMGRRSGRSS
jgi:kelch-like protein 10